MHACTSVHAHVSTCFNANISFYFHQSEIATEDLHTIQLSSHDLVVHAQSNSIACTVVSATGVHAGRSKRDFLQMGALDVHARTVKFHCLIVLLCQLQGYMQGDLRGISFKWEH